MSSNRRFFVSPYSLEDCADCVPWRPERTDENHYRLRETLWLERYGEETLVIEFDSYRQRIPLSQLEGAFLPARKAKTKSQIKRIFFCPTIFEGEVPLSAERCIRRMVADAHLSKFIVRGQEIRSRTDIAELAEGLYQFDIVVSDLYFRGYIQQIGDERVAIRYGIGFGWINYVILIANAILLLALIKTAPESDIARLSGLLVLFITPGTIIGLIFLTFFAWTFHKGLQAMLQKPPLIRSPYVEPETSEIA